MLGCPLDSPTAPHLSVSPGTPRKAWHCRTRWPEGEVCHSSPMVSPALHHIRGATVRALLLCVPTG